MNRDSAKWLRFAEELVRKARLDLHGLTVATECASGGYAYTPVIAAMAGAKVLSVGKDSPYGLFATNAAFISSLADAGGLGKNVEFFQDRLPGDRVNDADVFTNSGALRPFTRDFVGMMKPTAVIALMWETWEFRRSEIDLPACAEKSIVVVGTNEHFPPLDMYRYPPLLALKLAFDMGAGVANASVAVLGSGLTARLIYEGWGAMGMSVKWYGDKATCSDARCTDYDQLTASSPPDLVICAENAFKGQVAGPQGRLKTDLLRTWGSRTEWGHIMGEADAGAITGAGIRLVPEKIQGAEHMSYPTQHLGLHPVLELNAAGLLAGSIASRARKNGASVQEAIEAAVRQGVGMDFPGGFLTYARSLT